MCPCQVINSFHAFLLDTFHIFILPLTFPTGLFLDDPQTLAQRLLLIPLDLLRVLQICPNFSSYHHFIWLLSHCEQQQGTNVEWGAFFKELQEVSKSVVLVCNRR